MTCENRSVPQGLSPRDEMGRAGQQHLADAFEGVAKQQPHAPAWTFGHVSHTYAELDQLADQIAWLLWQRGVTSGQRVAVCLQPCPELVPAILAIVKLDACYVPLEADAPFEQLVWKLEDAAVEVVLTNVAWRFSETDLCLVALDQLLNLPRIDGSTRPPRCPGHAYICYTSGSTGKSKGVVIQHANVMALVQDHSYLRLRPGDRVAQAANPAFDAFTFELWTCLLHGAELVHVDKETYVFPKALAAMIQRERLTVMFLTTSVFHQCAWEVPDLFASMRYVLFGGERIEPALVERILAAGKPQHLLHVYGPTETTTFSTWHEVEVHVGDLQRVPIGRVLEQTSAYVLDQTLQPVPQQQVGELFLGGAGLAEGYLCQPRLTAAAFIPDPFAEVGGERLYRTGDQVVVGQDPELLYFVGRNDQQVKIRGFRVELGEVEFWLGACAGVESCAVLAQESSQGQRYLIGWYVGSADPANLTEQLAQLLPGYMVPSVLVRQAQLPLTANGKLDRQALAASKPTLAPRAEDQPTRSVTETTVLNIWAGLLNRADFGCHDNLFRLGAHSLLIASASARIQEELGLSFSMAVFFDYPTVAALADLIDLVLWSRQPLRTTAGENDDWVEGTITLKPASVGPCGEGNPPLRECP